MTEQSKQKTTDWNNAVRRHELVDVSEIKMSYLISELSKAVEDLDRRLSFVEKLGDFFDKLESGELDALTRLVSSEYRKNAVYQQLMNHSNWYRIDAHIDHIYLTQTNEKEKNALNALVPPRNLGSLVKKIEVTNPEELKTEGLEDFLCKGDLTKELPIAIYRNESEDSKIELIDGMHRTPSLFIGNEQKYLTLYIGRNN